MDDIGKSGSPSLYHYFVNKYGHPGSAPFVAAQRNFARSSAAYAVACSLLWIKDRHNGNILVNADGHLIHIDFGFLLGISPGGNLGFETASFKLTQEMVDILGGPGAEPYLYFQELACRGMLLAHQQAATIDTLVSGMADSGLECYHFDTTLQFLRQRQRWSDTPLEVASFMAGRILDAENNGNTLMYDGIQKAQNNIHSQRWQ
jgi:phosphatidylinositol 4-kinase